MLFRSVDDLRKAEIGDVARPLSVVEKIVDDNGVGHDPFERQIHVAALRRAATQATP